VISVSAAVVASRSRTARLAPCPRTAATRRATYRPSAAGNRRSARISA